MDVLSCLRKSYQRVSLERVLSGTGIVNIYRAICEIEAVEEQFATPPEVVNAALEGSNSQALTALNTFCESGCGGRNLALTLVPRRNLHCRGVVPFSNSLPAADSAINLKIRGALSPTFNQFQSTW